MPYATYRFNKIIAAETIRFIVTVAIVVYKGLKLVVYRMLTKNMSTKSKSVWGIVLKTIVAVATALAGVFGFSSCIGR